MSSEYELPEIETFVLKVQMHCQGCVNKVRKVLRKIEGVYKVDINAEEQQVIVIGSVNPSALINKLAKLGKHAEIWNSDYNQEQAYHGESENNNQAQYMIDDPSAYENPYMIPTFGKDLYGPGWYFDQGMSAVGNEINQHLAIPLFMDKVNNRFHKNFTSINENPKWEESLVPIMGPASFQDYSGMNYSDLGSREWAPNFLGVSSVREYNYHPFNMQRHYHVYHPSKMMQLSACNYLPYGISIPIQEAPTRNAYAATMNDGMMINAYIHQL